MKMLLWTTLLLGPVIVCRAFDNLFYYGLPYGSEAYINPVTLLLNGSYDMLQTQQGNKHILKMNYIHGFRNIGRNIIHPLENIESYGWKDFINDELFPSSLKRKNSQWVPNYTLHMLGGGLTYRIMAEWYHSRSFKYPKTYALLNCYAYHVINEVVENGKNNRANVDAIADLLIFNPLGILMFHNNKVASFFARTLHASNWSSMPLFNPVTMALENASLNFSFKYFYPGFQKLGLFAFTGMNSVLGVTCRLGKTYSVSSGFGMGTINVVGVDQGNGQRKMTARMGYTLAGFLDRNNSLLASMIFSEQRLYRLKLNVYPMQEFNFLGLKPGLFVALGSKNDFHLGLSFNIFPFMAGSFNGI